MVATKDNRAEDEPDFSDPEDFIDEISNEGMKFKTNFTFIL